jgi:hypothetical protein
MSCTQMFALGGNRTRDLLHSVRVFPPLRHIGRPNDEYDDDVLFFIHTYILLTLYPRRGNRGISNSSETPTSHQN